MRSLRGVTGAYILRARELSQLQRANAGADRHLVAHNEEVDDMT